MLRHTVSKALAVSARSAAPSSIPSARSFAPFVSRAVSVPAAASYTSRAYATSPTAGSSISDPAEEEARKALEEGTGKLEIGDWEGAKEAYERSISIHPTSSSHFNLGVVHFQLRNLDSSISSFHASLALSPDSPDAHTNLASAYVMSSPSRPDLAVEHLKKAAQLDPTDGEVQFNLGAVLEATERLPEALEAYQRSKKLGIARAEMNIRNVGAKILKVGMEEKAGTVDLEKLQKETRAAQGGEGATEGEDAEAKGKSKDKHETKK